MGWLKFKFGFQGTLENEIKRLFKKTPKIVRTEQQKEPAKLLAHFNQKIVIKSKERPRDYPRETPKSTLYRVHCGLSHVHFRAIEVAAVCFLFWFCFYLLMFSLNSFFLFAVGQVTRVFRHVCDHGTRDKHTVPLARAWQPIQRHQIRLSTPPSHQCGQCKPLLPFFFFSCNFETFFSFFFLFFITAPQAQG